MDTKQSEDLADIVVETIADAIDSSQVKGRFETLEQRIAHLEARPLQKWAGVHVTGTPYAEASLVTRDGSLWAAVKATTTTPGTPGSDWRLIVKKGHGA